MTFSKGTTDYVAKNHQLEQGRDESVLLSSHLEFELFTTNDPPNAWDGSNLFERVETYTLRQFATNLNKSVPLNPNVDPAVYTCHNYPVDMNKKKSNFGLGGDGVKLYTDSGVD